MNESSKRRSARKKRHQRIRKVVEGTSSRPRLAVFRSCKHIYAQAIDDQGHLTLASASTVDKTLQGEIKGSTGNKDAASVVGKAIAKSLLEQSISTVVFDRGGFLYHGRVKSLAEAAREAGLQF